MIIMMLTLVNCVCEQHSHLILTPESVSFSTRQKSFDQNSNSSFCCSVIVTVKLSNSLKLSHHTLKLQINSSRRLFTLRCGHLLSNYYLPWPWHRRNATFFTSCALIFNQNQSQGIRMCSVNVNVNVCLSVCAHIYLRRTMVFSIGFNCQTFSNG